MERHTWQKVLIHHNSREPSPRWGHCSVVRKDEIIHFGGYAGTSQSTQTRTTWATSGLSARPTWLGASARQRGKFPQHGPTVLCTTNQKAIASCSSAGADPTKSASTAWACWIGRAKYGERLSRESSSAGRGRELTILHNCCTRIWWCLGGRDWPTWTISGRSTCRPSSGARWRWSRAERNHVRVGFILQW